MLLRLMWIRLQNCFSTNNFISSFVINYANPVKDKILDIASLEKFLQVGGKAGAVIDSVNVTCYKSKITVTSDSNFSER
jgi:hypothetical protein